MDVYLAIYDDDLSMIFQTRYSCFGLSSTNFHENIISAGLHLK